MPSGGGFEFGVDPNEDPELALALRVSMEEQRARQEAESAATGPAEGQPAAETPAEAEDDPVLARALAMSVDQAESGQKTPDLSAMTEDEQIAYAMRMSMQEDASTPTQAEAGGEKMEVDEEAGDKNEDDYSEAMNDPAFLQVWFGFLGFKHDSDLLFFFQSVLENLPGVDPQSDAVRQAVGAMSKSSGAKKDEKKDDKSGKKWFCTMNQTFQ